MAQRDIEVGEGVEAVLHHGGLDGGVFVEGLEGGEVGVGDAERADGGGDVGFEDLPDGKGLRDGGVGGVED